ncbi:hypothetical protein A3F00_00290 [Candidatus Daviesbacteria bacterium RIFCSPHIGHO2_12_FULL_37_11]|uniref:Antitoxin n=1 Tax=Candidatus Daviesbacteria bacterium RIFCSPHIGHO2_12_FULL_37_11 TaxID=1797777 RepID=A0A1F5KAE2_9BACT|nr:MAG: hypothetical protein A2111_01385 [Candidatus Daviesbacteria bacterium GWA1_38_6]OGE16277.1 MAG: hypothetical protein A2769_03315 [Candidatus Daviesbacteria bacterium RIFCSPHIGHO2_01_FULL_37_27]OGE37932.1 MAG: hypothetical protein A3F00_00290 [Candidatus Daviesbacteria bacterium RIFCSPHIGHO2_12_FULL_37_11]OGE45274.1 MAG: hypothetical protein A3B39_04075 [Candidatus Daviesbacteria bacterium RIFCSPLOWO2_01_FULL_37_10]
MQYITFTELRTKSHNLAKALENGEEIKLVRKSRIVGKIIPDNSVAIKSINAKKLETKIDRLDLPSLTMKEIDRRYRLAMMKKHGQGIA